MKYSYWFLAAVLLLQACDKDEDAVTGSVDMEVRYSVDGQALLFDSLLYANAAGNAYSVYRLQYFLSDISLVREDNSLQSFYSLQYMDAQDASTSRFTGSDIPVGDYKGLQFYIGVDPARNITGGLPNTVQNNNMEWPVTMGGGYHFLKFEGHYMYQDTLYGFTMHLGMNPHRIRVNIQHPVHVHEQATALHLVMNLNEWFRNPEIFDFNTDGNYTMGNDAAMHKLFMNGSDVFTLE